MKNRNGWLVLLVLVAFGLGMKDYFNNQKAEVVRRERVVQPYVPAPKSGIKKTPAKPSKRRSPTGYSQMGGKPRKSSPIAANPEIEKQLKALGVGIWLWQPRRVNCGAISCPCPAEQPKGWTSRALPSHGDQGSPG